MENDLHVKIISPCLNGVTIDVIVTGSIGAVEAPRLIRSLRRLGANVRATLTESGSMFITAKALEWASAQAVTESFSGLATHLATSDLILVAPMTADFLAKMALGISNDPGSTLFASALGQGKNIIAIPSMHDSLWNSPITQRNFAAMKDKITFLQPRIEEGKRKFPDPSETADEIAHLFNQKDQSVVISMGPTRGYIDDVRYMSNYSSGALGTKIAEELYRWGINTLVVSGPSEIKPKSFSKLYQVETHTEMKDKLLQLMNEGNPHLIMAAAVLDYEPSERTKGKIRSSANKTEVKLKKTDKIISMLPINKSLRIGFKLEPSDSAIDEIAAEYMKKHHFDFLFVNRITDVSASAHSGTLFSKDQKEVISSKLLIAQKIREIILGV